MGGCDARVVLYVDVNRVGLSRTRPTPTVDETGESPVFEVSFLGVRLWTLAARWKFRPRVLSLVTQGTT